ncbi:hypothetical protein QJS66_23545 (plasmid) [Kocuria rhizophila]|nr:hypothetical protein QJS66_23545 [Kocuria rhizophila]
MTAVSVGKAPSPGPEEDAKIRWSRPVTATVAGRDRPAHQDHLRGDRDEGRQGGGSSPMPWSAAGPRRGDPCSCSTQGPADRRGGVPGHRAAPRRGDGRGRACVSSPRRRREAEPAQHGAGRLHRQRQLRRLHLQGRPQAPADVAKEQEDILRTVEKVVKEEEGVDGRAVRVITIVGYGESTLTNLNRGNQDTGTRNPDGSLATSYGFLQQRPRWLGRQRKR